MILFFIIIGLLIYIIALIREMRDDNEGINQTAPDAPIYFADALPTLLNKTCEIIVDYPLPIIDIMYNAKGILIDFDDDWILLKITEKKRTTLKVIRTEIINDIKEII